MGVSTDAILFLGWNLEEVEWWTLSGAREAEEAGEDNADEIQEDFQERCAKRLLVSLWG